MEANRRRKEMQGQMWVRMIETDRCGDTPRRCQGSQLDRLIAGRHADFIRASGQEYRNNRPDTWPQPATITISSNQPVRKRSPQMTAPRRSSRPRAPPIKRNGRLRLSYPMVPRLRQLLTPPNDGTKRENRFDLRGALKKGAGQRKERDLPGRVGGSLLRLAADLVFRASNGDGDQARGSR